MFSQLPRPMSQTFIRNITPTILGLLLLVTWLGSLGRFWWPFDLLAHFRLQYVLCAAAIGVLAWLRRHSRIAVFAVASCIWNVWLVVSIPGSGFTPAEEIQPQKPLRVLTFNVLITNQQRKSVVEHVLKTDADIVCLIEVDQSWRQDLEPLYRKYPQQADGLGFGNFSVVCFSRLPMERFEILDVPTLVVYLEHEGRPLTFIGAHPRRPFGEQNFQERRRHIRELAALLKPMSGEVILACDLNSTPWCDGMRLLMEESGMAFNSVPPVWVPTWGCDGPHMIPIDHVLVKNGLMVLKREIGPDLGSDHRSVLVEIAKTRGL
jgi:endonuclease/exonuclease/phosphatase (EEP) superfamily protein YafD